MPVADYVAASSDLFAALKTPILAGRELTDADREDSERVIVVSRTFALQSWPGVPLTEVIGKRVKLGGTVASPAPWLTVVGVAADVTRFALDETPVPVMYVPHRQGPYPSLTTMPFVVRAANGDARALVPAVRQAAVRAGLDVPIANAAPYSRMVERVSEDARFAMALMTGFALMAVVLSMAGLYGVVAFTASERRGELGIRTALGAAPAALLRLVIGDGLRPVLVGGLAGVSAAMLMARWMRVLLFHTSPFDASVALGALVLLAVAALAACAVPAMRACRADPRLSLFS
jgi:putative ABC transport system permease protein